MLSAFICLQSLRLPSVGRGAKSRTVGKENIKAQLTALKNQISPHFLFNNSVAFIFG
jgi:LytS/YehU family sensor histidine kinase